MLIFSLNTTCKHSQCRAEVVCKPFDLKTGLPSFGGNNLNQSFPVVPDEYWITVNTVLEYCIFRPFLFTKVFHFGNILGMSGATCSLVVMLQDLSGWGQDSNRATLEGVFSSVEAFRFLIYLCALGRCPIASPILYWASIGGKITLNSPAKSLYKLWNSISYQW